MFSIEFVSDRSVYLYFYLQEVNEVLLKVRGGEKPTSLWDSENSEIDSVSRDPILYKLYFKLKVCRIHRHISKPRTKLTAISWLVGCLPLDLNPIPNQSLFILASSHIQAESYSESLPDTSYWFMLVYYSLFLLLGLQARSLTAISIDYHNLFISD